MFFGTAALFIFGTLACLWHLRWMRRLHVLSEFDTDLAQPARSTIRCSIVVAARNEQTRVEHTVRRLLAQTHVEVELIVVNDRSTDRTGEIQLTNGLRELLKSRPIYACEVHGVRHDTGNKLGYLKAMVYFAMKRPDLVGPFVEYLETLQRQPAQP